MACLGVYCHAVMHKGAEVGSARIYTHLGDPLYFMCGTPFEQVLLFVKLDQLADDAAGVPLQQVKTIRYTNKCSSQSWSRCLLVYIAC